ncbi:MAG: hypothetical protein ACRD28_13455 [Acidobacteriaceae bacterium]
MKIVVTGGTGPISADRASSDSNKAGKFLRWRRGRSVLEWCDSP